MMVGEECGLCTFENGVVYLEGPHGVGSTVLAPLGTVHSRRCDSTDN